MTEPRYVLEMDTTQAQIIGRACELLGRLTLGQLEDIVDAMDELGVNRSNNTNHELKQLIKALTPFILADESPRITEKGAIALDLWRVIRHRLAHDTKTQHLLSIDYDPPTYRQQSDRPLAVMKPSPPDSLPAKRAQAENSNDDYESSSLFEVVLPTWDFANGQLSGIVPVSSQFSTKAEAIEFAQYWFDADEDGNTNMISEIHL